MASRTREPLTAGTTPNLADSPLMTAAAATQATSAEFSSVVDETRPEPFLAGMTRNLADSPMMAATLAARATS